MLMNRVRYTYNIKYHERELNGGYFDVLLLKTQTQASRVRGISELGWTSSYSSIVFEMISRLPSINLESCIVHPLV